MAYTNIDGETPETRQRLDIHERLGALASLQIRKPEQVPARWPCPRCTTQRFIGECKDRKASYSK